MKEGMLKRPKLVWFVTTAAILICIIFVACYVATIHKNEKMRYWPGEQRHPEEYFANYEKLTSLIGKTRQEAWEALGVTDQTVELISTGHLFGIPLTERYAGNDFAVRLRFVHGSSPSCVQAILYETEIVGTETEAAVWLLRLREQLEKDIGSPWSESFRLDDWISQPKDEESTPLDRYDAQWDLGAVTDPLQLERVQQPAFGQGEHVRYWLYLWVHELETDRYCVKLDWTVERRS